MTKKRSNKPLLCFSFQGSPPDLNLCQFCISIKNPDWIKIVLKISRDERKYGMEVKESVIIPLGYGKFVRSDRIIALERIEDDRGPGRRTRVFVEQMNSPLIAARTETSVLTDMVETPQEILEVTASFELLHDIYDDISQIGPMLRKSIKKEAQLDLDKIGRRIEELLKRETYLEDN